MVTTRTPTAPSVGIDDMEPSDGSRGYILIPLAEFGQSLDNPDLDIWFEAFAERNKDEVGDFEITAQGELKIMPPTGIPGAWYELEMASAVLVWSHDYGGIASGSTIRFVMPDGAGLAPMLAGFPKSVGTRCPRRRAHRHSPRSSPISSLKSSRLPTEVRNWRTRCDATWRAVHV